MGESQGSGTDAPAEVPRDSYSQREALHWAGGAAMAAALGPALLAAGCTSTSPGPSAEIDVAIVGGGPSGLYAAHRDAPP